MIKKVFSVFLAVLLLASNTGLSLTTHYCRGKAVKSSVSLGLDKLSCGMVQKADVSCENDTKSSSLKRKSCCENKHLTYAVEDEYNNSEVLPSGIDHEFIAAFLITYFYSCVHNTNAVATFTAYSPPTTQQDISVLYQVFRI